MVIVYMRIAQYLSPLEQITSFFSFAYVVTNKGNRHQLPASVEVYLDRDHHFPSHCEHLHEFRYLGVYFVLADALQKALQLLCRHQRRLASL